jgi:hypothetical protein
MRRIVTVVAVAIVSLKKKTIPRMKKGIPFIGHFDQAHSEKIKRPAEAGLFSLHLTTKSSGPK